MNRKTSSPATAAAVFGSLVHVTIRHKGSRCPAVQPCTRALRQRKSQSRQACCGNPGKGDVSRRKPLRRIRLLLDRRRARVTHRALFSFLLRNRQIDIWSSVRLTLLNRVFFRG